MGFDEGLGSKHQSHLYSVVLEFFLVLFYIYPIVPSTSAFLHSSIMLNILLTLNTASFLKITHYTFRSLFFIIF